MSDETNSAEVKVEAVTEVAAEVETKPETKEPTFFDVFDVITSGPTLVGVLPLEPEEPVVEPNFTSAEYNGHKVEFNEAGDCFISKDGQCLGLAAGVITKVSEVKDLIDQREAEKGE